MKCKSDVPLHACALLFLLLVLAACSGQPPVGSTSNGNATTINVAGEQQPLTVNLVHAPVGTADLTWKQETKTLTVLLKLTGLTPKSSHPAHIHTGTCQNGGPMRFMLQPVVADASGVGTSVTELTGINGGIPTHSWFMNVHNGPGLTPPDQGLPIACGNITTAKQEAQVHIMLGETPADNQHAFGQAQLSIQQNALIVTVTMHGLVPRSAHMEHIHAGSCQAQGKVVYMLTNLVADANGNATATTRITQVSQIQVQGWYLNVHRSAVLTNQNGTINQTNFDPIACGNITTY